MMGMHTGKQEDKVVFFCRWYDTIHKWLQKFYQGNPTYIWLTPSAMWLDTGLTKNILYMNDKWAEKEVRRTAPFRIARINIIFE